MHENFTLSRVIMSFLFILELSRWDVSTLNFLLGSALGRYPLASVGLCGEQRTYKGHIPERSAGPGF